MDYDEPGITVLSADGTVLRTVGQAGEGPGEFRWIRNLQILPADSLLVYDLGLGRITVFVPNSSEVAYVTNLDLAGSSSPVAPRWVEKLSDRNIFLATAFPPLTASGDPAEDYEHTMVLRSFGIEGTPLRDSLLALPAPQHALVARQGGRITATPMPFGHPGVLKLGPGNRVYYGRGDSLAIEIYSLEGQRIGGFSSPHEPPPITDQDIEGFFDSESEARTFRPALETFLEEYASGTWPAFENFVVDDQGRIWIGLLTPTGEPTEWVAFTDSGTPICSITLPDNVELELIQDGKAYGVATDELDVPRVVVYEIEEQQS